MYWWHSHNFRKKGDGVCYWDWWNAAMEASCIRHWNGPAAAHTHTHTHTHTCMHVRTRTHARTHTHTTAGSRVTYMHQRHISLSHACRWWITHCDMVIQAPAGLWACYLNWSWPLPQATGTWTVQSSISLTTLSPSLKPAAGFKPTFI